MGKPYWKELEQIPSTVDWALGQDVSGLRQTLVHELADYNLVAVGSGGSLVAAAFAAMLHEDVTGHLARSATPLEVISRRSTRNTAALLVSARGTNADIQQAAKSAPKLGYARVSAVSTSEATPLARILEQYGGAMHEFSLPSGRDGFLATNSLIATLVLLYRAASPAGSAQDDDGLLLTSRPALTGSQTALLKRTVVVLAQGWATPAAVDFETRFAEAALANVAVTDLRNFAHGRHNWLSLHSENTGIVSLETSGTQSEAARMLKHIPDGIDILRVKSSREGPAATIELVSTVMQLAGDAARNKGIDPGRPSVSQFGRRLYRAGAIRRREVEEEASIGMKRTALFLTARGPKQAVGGQALRDFVQRLERTSFRSLVVDYDGTLCARDRRSEPLDASIRAEMGRLLDLGMVLGIASGRGSSVYSRLRESVDRRHWNRVVVGLYNGAKIVNLSENLHDTLDDTPSVLEAALSRMRPLERLLDLEVISHPYQLSLRPLGGLDPYKLRTITIEQLAGVKGCSVVASSHSVDIIPAGTSKNSIVDALRTNWPGCVLRIGDQGGAGGNDFELLNSGLSLSVDRVSSRLETCWKLGTPGLTGPGLTLQYLRALSGHCGHFRLDVGSLLDDSGGLSHES